MLPQREALPSWPGAVDYTTAYSGGANSIGISAPWHGLRVFVAKYGGALGKRVPAVRAVRALRYGAGRQYVPGELRLVQRRGLEVHGPAAGLKRFTSSQPHP